MSKLQREIGRVGKNKANLYPLDQSRAISSVWLATAGRERQTCLAETEFGHVLKRKAKGRGTFFCAIAMSQNPRACEVVTKQWLDGKGRSLFESELIGHSLLSNCKISDVPHKRRRHKWIGNSLSFFSSCFENISLVALVTYSLPCLAHTLLPPAFCSTMTV